MISLMVTKAPCVCAETSPDVFDCSDDCVAGENISDSMIETEYVAQMRAASVINANDSDRIIVNGRMPLSSFIKPGLFSIYTDIEQGEFVSLVTSSTISIKKTDDSYTADLTINLEHEA